VNLPDTAVIAKVRGLEISQALVNLLLNSYDAVSGFRDRWVRITLVTREPGVRIESVDSGRGIPLALREKLFRPFHSTKPLGQGRGLGLSISKDIVDRHGGRLFLDETSPHTRFVVELPLGC